MQALTPKSGPISRQRLENPKYPMLM
jgi:hypothetical protein